MNVHEQPTATLARFILGSTWESLPARVQHEVKRCLLNFLGAALGGARDQAVEYALAVLREHSGPPQAGIIGRSERVDRLTAAFVNAASGNVLDFDDTHYPSVIHPSAPVAPPLLALSEGAPMPGATLLHALALGIEIACRLGNAVTPRHYVRGWHITSTCGVVGAAAGAAKAMALDFERTVWALGLAANQACGLVESLGSMAKSVSVGNAARNGLLAALLAKQGFTAAPLTLEGERGFVRVLGETPCIEALTEGLGERWEISRNALKPYPSGVVLHPVVDACLSLREQYQIEAESVQRVRVRGNPLLRQRADRPAPRSGREAAVSAQHSVAVCFLYGAAGVSQYTDACTNAPAVQSFGERVVVEEDASIAVDAAQVLVELSDGRSYERDLAHGLGSLERPLSDAQLEAKVRELASRCDHAHRVPALIDAVWGLDRSEDAAEVIRMLA
ncbi:MAG: MmgE/PrpD family protein [Burkholderiales bacterium]|nr:MmgE/PrpD family protein [Burkholderiales bacterium]